MKKNILLATLLLSSSLMYAGIEPVQDITEGVLPFYGLQQALVKITETGSRDTQGPDIAKLSQEKNRKFFAKIDAFGFDRWLAFENKGDADHIQTEIHNGHGRGVVWYYLDVTHLFSSKL